MNRQELTEEALMLVQSQTPVSRILAQANEITEAAYNLSRDQKRILFIVVGRLRNASRSGGLDSAGACEFTVAEYASMYNLPSAEASKDIRKAVNDFALREVVVHNAEESTSTEKASDTYPWMIKRAFSPRRGVYVVHLNPYLMPFFTLLDKRFTKLQFSEVATLTSPYAMRLYESLCQYKNENGGGFAILGVDWMRERYALPQSYQRYAEFKRNFLVKAVQEIEEKTKMKIVFTEMKQGVKVDKIKFTYHQG